MQAKRFSIANLYFPTDCSGDDKPSSEVMGASASTATACNTAVKGMDSVSFLALFPGCTPLLFLHCIEKRPGAINSGE